MTSGTGHALQPPFKGFKVRYLGIGLLWSVVYCCWFSGGFFPDAGGVGAVAHMTYQTDTIVSAIAFFIIPLLAKRGIEVCRKSVLCVTAVLMVVSIAALYWTVWYNVGSALWLTVIQHSAAALMGVGFAIVWTGWGVFFSKLDAEMVEMVVPLSFLVTPVALFLVSLMKSAFGVMLLVMVLAVGSIAMLIASDAESRPVGDTPCQDIPTSKAFKSSFLRVCLYVLAVHAMVAFVWASVSSGYFSSFGNWFMVPMLIGSVFAFALSLLGTAYARTIDIISVTRWCMATLIMALALVVFPVQLGRELGRVMLIAMQLVFNMAYLIYFSKIAHEGYASPYLCIGVGRGVAQAGVALGTMCGLPLAAEEIAQRSLGFQSFILGFIVICALILVFLASVSADARGEVRRMERPQRTDDAADEDHGDKVEPSPLHDVNGATVSLTPREREVLLLVLEGRNAPYIRDELCISKYTVDSHMRSIYAKLGVHSRQELISLVREV